ncbi:hypothetical protein IZU99_02685 [Oscillospiraceae bacterium CM]|nr:hypothetical protein IZU99_02685 [Oscillospiraceae bacterium CM]
MVKIIMGVKGSGKTKQLIDLVNKAVNEENGDVVCIEKGQKLTYDIPHAARLIEASEYGFTSYDFLKGFISGLHAENYDITHVFIDSLLKILDQAVDAKTEDFIDWCEAFSERANVKFTITISAETSLATEGIRKFF